MGEGWREKGAWAGRRGREGGHMRMCRAHSRHRHTATMEGRRRRAACTSPPPAASPLTSTTLPPQRHLLSIPPTHSPAQPQPPSGRPPHRAAAGTPPLSGARAPAGADRRRSAAAAAARRPPPATPPVPPPLCPPPLYGAPPPDTHPPHPTTPPAPPCRSAAPAHGRGSRPAPAPQSAASPGHCQSVCVWGGGRGRARGKCARVCGGAEKHDLSSSPGTRLVLLASPAKSCMCMHGSRNGDNTPLRAPPAGVAPATHHAAALEALGPVQQLAGRQPRLLHSEGEAEAQHRLQGVRWVGGWVRVGGCVCVCVWVRVGGCVWVGGWVWAGVKSRGVSCQVYGGKGKAA